MKKINDIIKLNNGIKVKNRLVKVATSENLCENLKVSDNYINLYKKWNNLGAGIIITGNMMIDSNYLVESNNLTLDISRVEELKRIRFNVDKSLLIAQLNHPGGQSFFWNNKDAISPSGYKYKGIFKYLFNKSRPLSSNGIEKIISQYVLSAKKISDAKFDGVQLHVAHGYLLSQFLSNKYNKRKDEYGGNILNRSRILIEIINKIRKQVNKKFIISVKFNINDLNLNELKLFIGLLDKAGVDLLEISGGTYENPTMIDGTGEKIYFKNFIEGISFGQMKVIITGGNKNFEESCRELEKTNIDFIGSARKFITNNSYNKTLIDKFFPMEIIWYTYQIKKIANNSEYNKNYKITLLLKYFINSLSSFFKRRLL